MALPTLFSPAPGDQSLQYLFGIFGSVNGVIPHPYLGGSGPGVTMITLMGALFSQFNTIVLAIGVLIVVYTTVVGIMNTAHEGQFMGKNWNNLWIPIRTVIGIAALVPTGSGFSGLQIIMMWVIVQGVGAADTLWSTALGYYATFGSIYAKTAIPMIDVKTSINGLFRGLVCAKSAAASYPYPLPDNKRVKYFCNQQASDAYCTTKSKAYETFNPSFSNPMQTTYDLGPEGACGTLTYCNLYASCLGGMDSLACKTCAAQVKALKESIPLLAAIAEKYVTLDHEYLVYWGQVSEDAEDAGKVRGAETSAPTSLESAEKKYQEDLGKEAAKGSKLPSQRSSVTPPPFVKEYCDATNNVTCTGIPSAVSGSGMNASREAITKVIWEYGLSKEIGNTTNGAGSEGGAGSEDSEGGTGSKGLVRDDFINTIINNYIGGVNQEVLQFMQSLNERAKGLYGPLAAINNAGWIIAGSSYFIIAQGNSQNLTAMMPKVYFKVPDNKIPTVFAPLKGYRNNYKAADTLACLARGGSDCGDFNAWEGTTNGARDAVAVYEYGLSMTETDGLTQAMADGKMYLALAETTFWTNFASTIALAIVAMVASLHIWGNGLGVGSMPLFVEMVMVMSPIMMALCGFFMALGTTLGVYLPLIPFMIFTLGAIGWMISTVEAMVAGPLVALGIISPSGQHDVLGKAETALGLLFAVFMRPSLMIFGMFAGMLIMSQVIKMGNAGFSMVKGTGNIGQGGMLASIVMMFTHAAFLVTIVNKSFSVIHIIPERVLGWIGISVPQEGADLSELKGGVEKGSQQAQAVASAMNEGQGKVARAAADKHDKAQQGKDDSATTGEAKK